MSPEFMDDIQVVMFHLRHSCENVRTIKIAIKIILNKTNMTEDRIKKAMKYIVVKLAVNI